jgi:drug/metabolite transporter (DMT)-like permease
MSHNLPPLSAVTDGAPADRPLAGILLLLAAMAVIPVLDAIAKHLGTSYPIWEIAWGRFFFHFILLAPFVLWRYGGRGLWPARPALQLVRGGLMLTTTVFFFAALRTLPLADNLAIFFISPMVVTVLSALVLKEKVGIRRWSAVAVGFIGAALIIRPGGDLWQVGALFALGAALSYAFYAILTRRLSGTAPPLVTLTYTAMIGAVAMSAVMPFLWVAPSAPDLALMVTMGAIAAFCHYLIIRAFEQAPASLLAPYGYAEIVTATALGYVIFGDFPDPWTWAGIAIVISGGIYLSLRERQAGGG